EGDPRFGQSEEYHGLISLLRCRLTRHKIDAKGFPEPLTNHCRIRSPTGDGVLRIADQAAQLVLGLATQVILDIGEPKRLWPITRYAVDVLERVAGKERVRSPCGQGL